MQKKIKILKELKSYLLSNYGDSVKEVVLFGSQAKGDEKYESDFDVLIILSQDYIWRDENKIIDLCYEVGLKYEIIIDVHIISQNELNSIRGKQPIFLNAINSGLYA